MVAGCQWKSTAPFRRHGDLRFTHRKRLSRALAVFDERAFKVVRPTDVKIHFDGVEFAFPDFAFVEPARRANDEFRIEDFGDAARVSAEQDFDGLSYSP
jgi:hypothetical protein